MKTAICIAMMAGMNLMAQAPTVILGTDLVSTSRETINANFLGLYNQKATTADCSGTPGAFITVLTPTTATCEVPSGPCVTCVTAVTASAPFTSSGGTTPNISATLQGNGTKIATSSGTPGTGECANFDASHVLVGTGAPCSSGPCATCVTAASSLTLNGIVIGAGLKASSVSSAFTWTQATSTLLNENAGIFSGAGGFNTIGDFRVSAGFIPPSTLLTEGTNTSLNRQAGVTVSMVTSGTNYEDTVGAFYQKCGSSVCVPVGTVNYPTVNDANLWIANGVIDDGIIGGAIKTGTHMYGWDCNENTFDTSSIIFCFSAGGNGSAQPAQSTAYGVNTLGSGLLWGNGFATLDGVTNTAFAVSAQGSTASHDSQEIAIFSRDSGNNVLTGTLSLDLSGNMLFGAPNAAITIINGTTQGTFYSGGLALGTSADLFVQHIKSTTGTRYVCVNNTGQFVSSASACSGT